MAKKPKKQPQIDPPDNDRFGDWSLDNIIPIEPGEVLVNDNEEEDPNMFANVRKPPKK